MNKYEKTFYSTSGEEFRADVYSVLEAFQVTCPARQHAVKKLLMPGQRGSKDEVQDLDESLESVARAVEMAYARRRGSDGTSGVRTLGGLQRWHADGQAEPEPIPEGEAWVDE